MNIQHKSSTLLRATDLLPNPTTVSRNISSRADTVKTDLAITLQSAYKDNGSISFTSDMWTDAHRKRSYITITAHFITPAWTLCSRVLCTEEFDPAAKKTGVNVRLSMLAVFASCGITTSQISRSVFTTDRGSNMIVALQQEERIDCIAHILNTVLRHTFDEEALSRQCHKAHRCLQIPGPLYKGNVNPEPAQQNRPAMLRYTMEFPTIDARIRYESVPGYPADICGTCP